MKLLNHKLSCKKCGTIYLDIDDDTDVYAPVRCSGCGLYLGTWAELERDFNEQGGQDGVFELRDGQFARKD